MSLVLVSHYPVDSVVVLHVAMVVQVVVIMVIELEAILLIDKVIGHHPLLRLGATVMTIIFVIDVDLINTGLAIALVIQTVRFEQKGDVCSDECEYVASTSTRPIIIKAQIRHNW